MIKVTKEKGVEILYFLCKPSIAIPKPASKVHGIYSRHVKNKKHFSLHIPEMIEFAKGCDIIGYNVHFDLNMIDKHIHKAENMLRTNKKEDTWVTGDIFDLFNIYCSDHPYSKNKPRKLANCYKEFIEMDAPNTHCALTDALACMEMMDQMIHHYCPANITEDWERILFWYHKNISFGPYILEGSTCTDTSPIPYPVISKRVHWYKNIEFDEDIPPQLWMLELIPPNDPAAEKFTFKHPGYSEEKARKVITQLIHGK
jgi:hypothetical protein